MYICMHAQAYFMSLGALRFVYVYMHSYIYAGYQPNSSFAQTKQVSRAANRITITLAANIGLPAGATIECNGFDTATNIKIGVMSLQGPSAAHFGRTSEFKIDVRTSLVRLQMVLSTPAPADELLVFSFVLQNRACSGECTGVPIMVSAHGGPSAPNIQIPGDVYTT